MNKNEIRTAVKENVIEQLSLDSFPRIKDYSFVIPVEVDGMTIYARVDISTFNWYDTKANSKFDLDTAIAIYQNELEERAKVAAEKAAKKPKERTPEDIALDNEVLSLVASHGAEGASCAEIYDSLASSMEISKPKVTSILRRLEAEGRCVSEKKEGNTFKTYWVREE